MKRGFTLIELLVVIAIIGILASVVMASLSYARDKALDASIKSNLGSSRSQASLYYEDHGQVFTDVCGATGIGPMVLNAASKIGAPAVVGTNTDDFVYDANGVVGALNTAPSVCHDSDTAWATIVSLKSPSTTDAGWCVDSTGASMESTHLLIGETVCQ